MSEDLPRAAAAVVTAGRSLGLELDVREFPEGTRTAADAARAVGCQVDQIVKSLVFMADTDPVLVDWHLTGFAQVWAAAGTPRHVFPIAPADLVRATGGQVADITLAQEGPPAG